LITHRIGADVCLARQRTFFHKCHRCIYRGQAANWEPEEPPIAMINIHEAEERPEADVKAVEVRRKEPAREVAQKGAAQKGATPKEPKEAARRNGVHEPKADPKRNGAAAPHGRKNGAAPKAARQPTPQKAAARNGAAEA
jgi:hypothetical protein